MKSVQRDASLHESTVQSAADLAAQYETPRRGRGPDKSSRKVQIVRQVDPQVWKTALGLADGDAKRLVVRSSTEVVVKNSRD